MRYYLVFPGSDDPVSVRSGAALLIALIRPRGHTSEHILAPSMPQ